MPSRQRVYGGGKFKSERQRRAMWANAPKAARAWAHNLPTTSGMWRGMHGGVRSAGKSVRRMSTKSVSRAVGNARGMAGGRGSMRHGGGRSFTSRGPKR